MPLFDGTVVIVGGKPASLRFGMKSLMRLDNELGEKYGLKESILALVTLDLGDGKTLKTTRLLEWLMDMGPGKELRWTQFLYGGVIHLKRFQDFEEFVDEISEEELAEAFSRLAEVITTQLSTGESGGEAAATSPLSRESDSGSTSGRSDESTSVFPKTSSGL